MPNEVTNYAKEITLLLTNFATDHLGVTISNFMLYPEQGEWETSPPPPQIGQVLVPNNLITFKVGNSTPTGGISGFIVISLGSSGLVNVGFSYLQNSYAATVNGSSWCQLGPYACSASVSLYSNQLTATINVGQQIGFAGIK